MSNKNNTNVKRVGLYFNLDNPIENAMWNYLENSRKKSDTIKNAIMSVMSDTTVQTPQFIKPVLPIVDNKNDILEEEFNDDMMKF